jgi:FtsZ-binding cell division protein ZapB
MDERTKNVMAIIAKFAPKLAPHGVKLSAEDAEKKELEAMALMSEAVLDNGNKIYTPAAEFTEGAEVFTMDADGNTMPLENGDYVTADGTVITVVDGKISSMVSPEAEQPETEIEVEVEQSTEQVTKGYVDELVNGIVAKFQSDVEAKDATISQLTKELNDLKSKYNQLGKQAAATSVKQARQSVPTKKLSEYATVQERVNALLFNR